MRFPSIVRMLIRPGLARLLAVSALTVVVVAASLSELMYLILRPRPKTPRTWQFRGSPTEHQSPAGAPAGRPATSGAGSRVTGHAGPRLTVLAERACE
jgi:hypothetical protein